MIYKTISNTYLTKTLNGVFETVLDCLRILIQRCTTQRDAIYFSMNVSLRDNCENAFDCEFYVICVHTKLDVAFGELFRNAIGVKIKKIQIKENSLKTAVLLFCRIVSGFAIYKCAAHMIILHPTENDLHESTTTHTAKMKEKKNPFGFLCVYALQSALLVLARL